MTSSLACLAVEKKAYPLIKMQREVTSTPSLLLRSLLPSLHYKKNASLPQEKERRRPTLKEMEERTYPFPDSDVSGILDGLLKKKIIKLLECKRLEEIGHTNDPKY